MRWILLIGLFVAAGGCSRQNPLFDDTMGGDTDGPEKPTDATAPTGPTDDDSDDATATVDPPSTSGETTEGPGSSPTTGETDPSETGSEGDTEDPPCAQYGSDCGGPGDPLCEGSEKCVPVGEPGEQSFKCVSLEGEAKAIGDACTQHCGPWEGIDDCTRGSICFGGQCTQLCLAPEDTCTIVSQRCYVVPDLIAGLCLDMCDPLGTNNCGVENTCVPAEDGSWVCVPDRSDGTLDYQEPCSRPDECPFGTVCVDASKGGCPAPCCTAVCSLESPLCDAQECWPWTPTPPPGYGDVGYCGPGG